MTAALRRSDAVPSPSDGLASLNEEHRCNALLRDSQDHRVERRFRAHQAPVPDTCRDCSRLSR